MEYGILGPLTVSRDGRELRLGGAKQRSVLAVLLLRANELVPTARLVDELWGERPPPTAVKAVQVQVSQLRKLLDAGALETRPTGYLLRVQPGALDLQRFETLLGRGRERLGEGDATAAGELLREALGLWRGSPLAEFEYEAFARNEIGRLEELRLAALELRLEADLALGRHTEVVGELEGLVRDHPLRESFARLSILALYRAGRQADALAVMQRTRTTLRDELGLDPGLALQQLEKQILLQDTALDLPPAAVVQPTTPALEPLARPRRAAPAPVCASCGTLNAHGAEFCNACGAPLVADASVETRKTVTVLFCDVVGFTELAGMLDPEALRALMSRFFELAAHAIERHGGMVEKFIGDEVMAVFGVPVVREDDALRAVRAAVEMRDELPSLETGPGAEGALEVRIGINTGEVVAGDPGTGHGFVTGEAVAIGKRLEQTAGPGEILLGELTHALVSHAVVAIGLEPLKLEGKRHEVTAFRLESVDTGAPASPRRDDAPFVGRQRELTLLRAAWERAKADERCELVTVVGDGGVGKSRLTAEALAGVDARVVSGRCLPYGEGITYWPVVEVLKQLDALPSDDAASATLRSLLGESDRPTSADEIAWAFRRLVEEQAPLVVVFDDLQWGEQTFLDLIESTALLSVGAPLLLVCMARPELVERRPSWPAPLHLEPLAADEADALIGRALPEDLRRRIAASAGGNPLFITEMLVLATDGGELEVPPTLRALLSARLDRLEPRERSLLERGAVEGEVFHRGAVQALAPDEPEVLPRLAALVRRELVRPERPQLHGEDAFRFCHLLIRDAAYDSLPKATRAELHEQFAGWLEQRGSELVDLDQLLGYHLSQAHRYRGELGRHDDETRALGERAATRLAAAGFRAHARGDLGAAANLLGRAAALLPSESRERIEVVLTLVEPLAALMRLAEIETLLEQAGRAAELLGDEGLIARANVEQAWIVVHSTAEQWSETALLPQVDDAILVFERLGDDVAVARALEVVTAAHLYHGRLSAVAAASERGYHHADRAHHVKLQGKHRLGREVADQWGATPLDRIEDLLGEDLAWARRTGSLGVEACATVRLGVTRALRGDRAAGNELFDRGMSACAELGTRIWAYQELGCWIWALTDDPAVAEGRLRETHDVLADAGKRGMVSTIASILGECLYRQERYDEAHDLLEEAVELGADDDIVTQAHVRAGRAKLCARGGKLDDAEAAAREGVALADATEFVDLRGDSLLALGEVLRLAGRKDEAAEATRQALAIWEAKGNVVHAERARSLLAQS